MKSLAQPLLLAIGIVVAACNALAIPSDPVGALRLPLRGNSDTVVSLPLQRPPLVEARLASRTGNALVLETPAIPALPAGGAYALVMSGALEGAVLPVASTTVATATVEPGAFDLSTLQPNDLVAIIPYWTLDTLFPAGANIHASPSRLVAQSQILVNDPAVAGINTAPTSVYFYFAGNGTYDAGWYVFGDMTKPAGATRLPPHGFFTVRHPALADTELCLTGSVVLAAYRIPVGTLQAQTAQDNFLALPNPLPVTLNASTLIESGAFESSTSRLVAKDQILIYDNTTVGLHKAAVSYFHFAGNSTYPAGWYRFGNMTQSAGNLVLKPGEGYVIRKAATANPTIRSWTGVPSYLQ